MADYYTLLTNAGIAYETARKADGTPIKLTTMSVGDGNGAVYNPDATAVALKREVWRGEINALSTDANNPSWLVAELTIPNDVGGWSVREAGIWTDTGILYAVVKYPESYKPVLATSGAGKEFYLRAIFQTSNAANVTLSIDETVVKATRSWVADYVAAEINKLDAKKSVRVVATAPITLSGAQQIDATAVVAGDRVLAVAQAQAKDNGLWIVANGPWARALDADLSAEVTPGLFVVVEEGAVYGDSLWQLVTNAPIVLGATALAFEMLAGKTGIGAGTYRSLTVDKYGRVIAGTNPTTLAGFGITDTYTKPEIDSMIAQASALPVGTMVAFPVNKLAPGFLEIDGSVKSIAAYPDLAGFLGTAFNVGNEGAGNFRLPESRAEFLRGWDHGRGVDAGRAIGSYQAGQVESHIHTYNVASVLAGSGTSSTATPTDTAGSAKYTNATGGTETRPRNLAVMWCIKAWNAPINQGNIDIAALVALAAQATENNQGTAKVATQALADAGVDDTTIVTPKKLRFGFAASFTLNGYITFPSWLGGFIIQWGTTPNISAGGSTVVPLPIAFTALNAVALSMAQYSAANNAAHAVSIFGRSNTGMSFYNSNTSTPISACWIALGK